jgi:hypothetical protein
MVDFLSILVELGCEKEGVRRRGNKQKEEGGGRSRAQDGAGAACIMAYPPPLSMPPYLSV